MNFLIKLELWFKKVSTLRIFSCYEINRYQFLASILIVWLAPLLFFLSSMEIIPWPWNEQNPIPSFLFYSLGYFTIFTSLLLQPIFILKRLRRVYGENICIKEFHLLSLRLIKVSSKSLSIKNITLVIFFFQLLSYCFSFTIHYWNLATGGITYFLKLYLASTHIFSSKLLIPLPISAHLFLFFGLSILAIKIFLIFVKDEND